MSSLTIIIPGLPPPLNHAYSHTAGGGKRRNEDVIAWQDAATLVVRNTAQVQGWRVPPKTLLAIEIRFTAPDILRWDLDGRLKMLLDAIAVGIGVDDAYFTALYVRKERGPVAETQVLVSPAGAGLAAVPLGNGVLAALVLHEARASARIDAGEIATRVPEPKRGPDCRSCYDSGEDRDGGPCLDCGDGSNIT